MKEDKFDDELLKKTVEEARNMVNEWRSRGIPYALVEAALCGTLFRIARAAMDTDLRLDFLAFFVENYINAVVKGKFIDD